LAAAELHGCKLVTADLSFVRKAIGEGFADFVEQLEAL